MISLLVPSRGRPESLQAMIVSAKETAADSTQVEVVVRLDDDDPSMGPLHDLLPYGVRTITGPRTLLSACWNECYEQAEGDIVMHAGDDIRFRTPGWDTLVASAFPGDGIAFVHGDDGFQGAALGTHGFVTRRWVQAVGYFVPPLFSSDYNDTWLNEVADRIGRRIYLPSLLTEHLHPAAGKGEWDATHRDRLERHQADDCDRIWRETEGLRARDADRLRTVMDAGVRV